MALSVSGIDGGCDGVGMCEGRAVAARSSFHAPTRMWECVASAHDPATGSTYAGWATSGGTFVRLQLGKSPGCSLHECGFGVVQRTGAAHAMRVARSEIFLKNVTDKEPRRNRSHNTFRCSHD